MTVEEFEEQYAARSGVTVRWLHEHGRFGARCDCGDGSCDGFQMMHIDTRAHSDPAAPGGSVSGELSWPGDQFVEWLSGVVGPEEGIEVSFPTAWVYSGVVVMDTAGDDVHSDNGDDLRRLDEVLEEQRQRIVALGKLRA